MRHFASEGFVAAVAHDNAAFCLKTPRLGKCLFHALQIFAAACIVVSNFGTSLFSSTHVAFQAKMRGRVLSYLLHIFDVNINIAFMLSFTRHGL